jgi:uncharacterized Zn-binding protein involved in type VI secretion
MPNAATLGCKTMCPIITPGIPPVPHISGGTIISGAPTVLIEGKPAARMTDSILCNGAPPHPDTILKGSSTVLICNMPAAYMSCSTASGGMIINGATTVQIGI